MSSSGFKSKIAVATLILLLVLPVLGAIVPTFAQPSITLTPPSGPSGTTVTVAGSGFTVEKVYVYFDSNKDEDIDTTDELLAGPVSVTGGSFTVNVVIPLAALDGYNIMILDKEVTEDNTPPLASELFTVTAGIVLSPNKGPAGTTVTITGSGFDANAPITVKFDTVTVATTESDGNGAFETTFTVPSVSCKDYNVSAMDGVNAYTATFTVILQISISPSSGLPGTTVTITGLGFTPSGYVNIYFDGAYVKRIIATTEGGISTTYTIPAGTKAGSHEFKAKDLSTNIESDPVTFTVPSPDISISPTSGPVGTEVTVSGLGFTPGGSVEIYFDATLMTTVTATAAGAIPTGTKITVPDTTAGAHKIKAVDTTTGLYDEVDFEVLAPQITLTPNYGFPGDEITVAGSNFKLGATVTIYFAGEQWGDLVTLTAGVGSFSVSRIVPSKLAGVYTVTATDGVNTASATFTVKSTAGGVEDVIAMLEEVEGKLDGTIESLITTINSKLGTFTGTDNVASLLYEIKADVEAITVDLTPVLNAISGAQSDIVSAIDSAKTDILTAVSGLGAKLDLLVVDADLNGVPDFIEEIDHIEAKLNALPAWGDLVTKNWADLTSALSGAVSSIQGSIDSAKSDILSAISSLSTQLSSAVDSITGSISSAKSDIVSAIDSAKGEIIAAMPTLDLTPVLTAIQSNSTAIIGAIDSVEAKLDNETYGLVAIKNAVSGLSVQLSNAVDTITGAIGDAKASILAAIDSVEAKLDNIKGVVDAIKLKTDTINWADITAIKDAVNDIELKLDALTAAQAKSGSGSTIFTSSGTLVIYEGSKVGTVTVSLKTTGVGYGERLLIRYYIDPNSPTVYIEKTVTSGTNTAGWTDTAAAWKVEIVYTWRSGTDTVYWSYSAIYPP